MSKQFSRHVRTVECRLAFERNEIPVIVGPTCSGKSDLVLEIFDAFAADASASIEIISADAFQVYTGMDIGTAKASAEVRTRIRHHLVDVATPREAYSAGRFVAEAEAAVGAIRGRGVRPVVVGGSMMYIWALATGLLTEGPVPDEELRGSGAGRDELLARLKEKDPEAAERLVDAPAPRIIRAIEVVEGTGGSWADWASAPKREPAHRYHFIELLPERAVLYDAINLRVAEMFERGFVEEVERLRADGITLSMPSQRAIGYREIHRMLEGELTREEAIELIRRNTRRYAKRQVTWMRHHRPTASI